MGQTDLLKQVEEVETANPRDTEKSYLHYMHKDVKEFLRVKAFNEKTTIKDLINNAINKTYF